VAIRARREKEIGMKSTERITKETPTRVKIKTTVRDDSNSPITERSTERWYPKPGKK
jgi:hypothetical protein